VDFKVKHKRELGCDFLLFQKENHLYPLSVIICVGLYVGLDLLYYGFEYSHGVS
jgi:hypothetical protein